MNAKLILVLLSLSSTSCIVAPQNVPKKTLHCEISSDQKTLRIIDLTKETHFYYSISGAILLPITGIVSGTYVAINNIYHLGEETIVCR